MALGKTF